MKKFAACFILTFSLALLNWERMTERMLEQAGTMFDNMEAMMYRLKKKAYKERMTAPKAPPPFVPHRVREQPGIFALRQKNSRKGMGEFREKNQEILAEMTELVERAEESERDEMAAQTHPSFTPCASS